jgi:protein gp37
MTDLFQNAIDPEIVLAIYGVMSALPRCTFQLLTKRPERARTILLDGSLADAHAAARTLLPSDAERVLFDRALGRQPARQWPPQNVWLGVSVEDQESAEKRIPYLVDTPAALRFVSAEPLLGPVLLVRWLVHERSPTLSTMAPGGVRWVIVGGESGPWARPMHPDWARDLRRQCFSVGTSFFFKQWGAWSPVVTEVEGMTTVPCSIHGPQQMGPWKRSDCGNALDGLVYQDIPERP